MFRDKREQNEAWRQAVNAVGAEMNFILRYDGHIPSGQNGKDFHSDKKQEVRLQFSKQLRKLWRDGPLSQRLADIDNIPFVSNKPLVGARAWDPFFSTDICGFRAIPLVTWHNRLSCELEVQFLGEPLGIVTRDGDLDNKVKIVFDALRLPRGPKEIPGSMFGSGTDALYCLLEDDALIRKFSVEANESLGSPADEELTVRVKVWSTEITHQELYQFK